MRLLNVLCQFGVGRDLPRNNSVHCDENSGILTTGYEGISSKYDSARLDEKCDDKVATYEEVCKSLDGEVGDEDGDEDEGGGEEEEEEEEEVEDSEDDLDGDGKGLDTKGEPLCDICRDCHTFDGELELVSIPSSTSNKGYPSGRTPRFTGAETGAITLKSRTNLPWFRYPTSPISTPPAAVGSGCHSGRP